jgi:ComF family protein
MAQRLERLLAWFAQELADCIAPRRCLGCDEPGSLPFCASCGTPAPFVRDPPEVRGIPVLVAGAYSGVLGEAIRRFKYQNRPDLARPLAELLVPIVRTARATTLTFVPVPLHAGRFAERGFNQSALLAENVARRVGAVSSPRALVRVRDTGHQAELERAERVANVASAFRARAHAPARALLIDDVVTSGETAAACIDALRDAGTQVCLVLAVAAAGKADFRGV